jgi:hypothetical protein
MSVDWLGPDHPQGTPPQSGVHKTLMGLLVTDPSEKSPGKFVRGHLLNEHLGGLGNEVNMFPITGNANSQHLHSTENRIKKWVGKMKEAKKKNAPDRWVYYEVKVTGISSQLDPKAPIEENYVDCVFVCRATLKDEAGKAEEDFSTSIPSVYGKVKQKATTVEKVPAKPKKK